MSGLICNQLSCGNQSFIALHDYNRETPVENKTLSTIERQLACSQAELGFLMSSTTCNRLKGKNSLVLILTSRYSISRAYNSCCDQRLICLVSVQISVKDVKFNVTKRTFAHTCYLLCQEIPFLFRPTSVSRSYCQ